MPFTEKKQFPLNFLKSLNTIIENILVNKNSDITTEQILNFLKANINIIAACYLKVNQEDTTLNLHSFTQSKFSSLLPIILPAVNKNLYDIKYRLDDDRVLISKSIRENKIIKSKNIKDFFYPVVKQKWLLDAIQKNLKIKLCIAIPIIVQGKPLGVYFIVTPHEKLTSQQSFLLQFHSNLLALALDINLKYEEIEKKYEIEKEATATLSHELKTPLAIAFNNIIELQLLIKKIKTDIKKLDGHTLQQLEILSIRNRENIKHLTDLTESILTLHQLESQKDIIFHTTDFKSRLQQLLDIFNEKANKKGLTFSYEILIEEGLIHGPNLQLEQILTILVDNAIKYTHEGGVTVHVEKNSKIISCTVVDSGIGIPKDKRRIVFEKFYRHRTLGNKNLRDISGIGLGLYIAKKVVELLDGKISINENTNGKGTQISIEIPGNLFNPSYLK